MARPGCILRTLSFLLFVQIQAQNAFANYPYCAQQYLNEAFPEECNTGVLTTLDECLCSNTDYFISNSMLSIGVNCGCDTVWATAYLMVTICDEYAGGSSMNEGQMIAAGNGGTSTCSTTTATPTLPSTLQPAVPTTTPASPTTATYSSPASSTATPTSQSSHGLDADGKLTLAVGLPGAIFACIQIIGWIRTRSFFWMFAKCCGAKDPKYQTLYQSPSSYHMSSR